MVFTSVRLLSALFFLLWAGFAVAEAPAVPLNGIAAVVNDDIITQQELNHRLQTVKKDFAQNHRALPKDEVLRKQVLNHFINEKLQLQVAQHTGVVIDDATLDAAVKKIREANHQDETTFKASLQAEGLTISEFRQQLKNQMLIHKLFERDVGSHITVTEEQVNNILHSPQYNPMNIKEYRVYDLLVELSDEPTSDEVRAAKKKITKLLADLHNGKDFKQLVVAESDGEDALQNGDLGWRRLEALPSIFIEPVKNMLPGNVAGPIRAPNGFHLILLGDLRQNGGHHYVDEMLLRHILLKPMAFDSEKDLQKTLKELKTKIHHGSDFATLAKIYSQDLLTKQKGGELGWVGPGTLVTPLELAVTSLKPGEITEPVQTNMGWHIVQLVKRRKKEDTAAFEEDMIRKMIYRQQLEQSRQQWIQQARGASRIRVLA
ncbi:MAG: peptidylprolyl isomerase [Gammaproteobacteria bacterium]